MDPFFIYIENLKEAIKTENLNDLNLNKKLSSNKELVIESSIENPKENSKLENKIQKCFYKASETIKNLTHSEKLAFRQKNGIKVIGNDLPYPISKFEDCGFSKDILEKLKEFGITTPTVSQIQSIPGALNGNDIILIAPTGSGKTLGYALPMLKHVAGNKFGSGNIKSYIRALIVAPTRELALQIYQVIEELSNLLNLIVLCTVGGISSNVQIKRLKRGVDILVGTPGRILDIFNIKKGKIASLEMCSFFVIDEMDRMMDLGFSNQIKLIAKLIHPEKQIIACSATLPNELEKYINRLAPNASVILCGTKNSICSSINQKIYIVNNDKEKFEMLLYILSNLLLDEEQKVFILIFTDTNNSADELFKDLIHRGFLCTIIHSKHIQEDRVEGLKKIIDGDVPILIATSLLARGLDIKGLDHVINYDPPSHPEDFIHRVGRTGRAGNPGNAYTILKKDQKKAAFEIKNLFQKCQIDVPKALDELASIYLENNSKANQKLIGFYGRGLYKIDEKRIRDDKIIYQAYNLKNFSNNDDEILTSIKKRHKTYIKTDFKPKIQINELKDPNTGQKSFVTDLTINNYPTFIRTQITSKGFLQALKESTSTLATVKGQYIPPNDTSDGSKDFLYLEIDGPTSKSVQLAYEMIVSSICNWSHQT